MGCILSYQLTFFPPRRFMNKDSASAAIKKMNNKVLKDVSCGEPAKVLHPIGSQFFEPWTWLPSSQYNNRRGNNFGSPPKMDSKEGHEANESGGPEKLNISAPKPVPTPVPKEGQTPSLAPSALTTPAPLEQQVVSTKQDLPTTPPSQVSIQKIIRRIMKS